MKAGIFGVVGLFFSTLSLRAQNQQLAANPDSLSSFLGNYQASIQPSLHMRVSAANKKFSLEIVGQGKTSMTALTRDSFLLDAVQPRTTIVFSRDAAGHVLKFHWLQQVPPLTWKRIPDSGQETAPPDPFEGSYQLAGSARVVKSAYKIARINRENGQWIFQATGEDRLVITPLGSSGFQYVSTDLTIRFDFHLDKRGLADKFVSTRHGSFELVKIPDSSALAQSEQGFYRPNGFTRADSLRGMLTPLRTCYDVLFYDLLVKIDPQQQFISGNNRIRFRVVHDFDRMQIDLFANMAIEKIVFQGKELAYTREFNAVFVRFPSIQAKGTEEEIDIFYSGTPQIPDAGSLAGGFFWMQDKQGHFWIESVSQGSGASLWWPCKDHLSDKPDSMQISVIVPRGLMDISNGRLRRTTELPANLTRFDWFVSYPINNYCVAVNIGNYAHFSDLFINGADTMDLNFYCMPYHLAIARQIFRHVQPMLRLYEADFGRYPFARDGFSIMESIYPMEHQSAVSMGSINNPFNSDKIDSLDLIRASWHESAHEWWGNSVSCQDMADLWIHEAFATYAEVLAYETFDGKAASLKYLHSDPPGNQQAIIGTYGVNDFHLGDMYSKGALLLHTLRNLIDNDSVWFSLLRGIQAHFAYQSVRTEDIEQYFSTATKTDYSYFFDQYLRHPAIPVLHIRMSPKGSALHLEYQWAADVPNFRMPVKVSTSKNHLSFIYPSSEWQSTDLDNMNPTDFRVDTDSFYIKVVIE